MSSVVPTGEAISTLNFLYLHKNYDKRFFASSSNVPVRGIQIIDNNKAYRGVMGADLSKLDTYTANPHLAIPDHNTTGVTSTINVPVSSPIHSARVYVDITHTWTGDLKITLQDPAGNTYTVYYDAGDPEGINIAQWYTVTGASGNAQGDWQMKVADLVSGDTGTFNTWKLEINGGTLPGTATASWSQVA